VAGCAGGLVVGCFITQKSQKGDMCKHEGWRTDSESKIKGEGRPTDGTSKAAAVGLLCRIRNVHTFRGAVTKWTNRRA